MITHRHTGIRLAILLVSNLLQAWFILLLTKLPVDLIDSMLAVNPEKRFTVDQCLAHPWMTASVPSVTDSTDGLVGGLAGLEVNRRGVVRERTLLASINSVQVTRLPGTNGKDPVEVHKKNPQTASKEPRPFDDRNPEEFVAMGGKGDQELFGDDVTSHYTKDTISAPITADPGPATANSGNGQHTQKRLPKRGAFGGKGKGDKH